MITCRVLSGLQLVGCAVRPQTLQQTRQCAGDSEQAFLVGVVVPEKKALEALAGDLSIAGEFTVCYNEPQSSADVTFMHDRDCPFRPSMHKHLYQLPGAVCAKVAAHVDLHSSMLISAAIKAKPLQSIGPERSGFARYLFTSQLDLLLKADCLVSCAATLWR